MTTSRVAKGPQENAAFAATVADKITDKGCPWAPCGVECRLSLCLRPVPLPPLEAFPPVVRYCIVQMAMSPSFAAQREARGPLGTQHQEFGSVRFQPTSWCSGMWRRQRTPAGSPSGGVQRCQPWGYHALRFRGTQQGPTAALKKLQHEPHP